MIINILILKSEESNKPVYKVVIHKLIHSLKKSTKMCSYFSGTTGYIFIQAICMVSTADYKVSKMYL